MTNRLTSLDMTDDAQHDGEPADEKPEDGRPVRTSAEHFQRDQRRAGHRNEQRSVSLHRGRTLPVTSWSVTIARFDTGLEQSKICRRIPPPMWPRLACVLCFIVLLQPAMCLAHRTGVSAIGGQPLEVAPVPQDAEPAESGKPCCGIRFHVDGSDEIAAPAPSAADVELCPVAPSNPTVWPPLPASCSSPPLVGYVVLLI